MKEKEANEDVNLQIKHLKDVAKSIGFSPEYFHRPKNKKELQIYAYQFVDFLREEKHVEIETQWIFEDNSSPEGYISDSWGIKDNYNIEDGRVKHLCTATEAFAPTFLESQIKAIEKTVEKLLEEEINGGN
ncbi:MAG: hypothetical protein ACOC2U_00780 [bacterium]